MSSLSHRGNILRQLSWVLVLLAIPAWARSQHEEHAPKAQSAPHRSEPAHQPASHQPASHGSASHGAAPSHTSTPSHTGQTTTGHTSTSTGHNTANTSHTTTGTSHTTTPGGTHTTTNSRGAVGGTHTTVGSRPGVNASNRGAGAGGHALPGKTVALKGGGTANIRPNGQIRSVDRNGMHIERGVGGQRTVVSERGGARIVTTGRGGYVQRTYMVRGGATYVSRTYVVGGVTRVGVYRSYYYGGHAYYGFHPGFWYHPGFYGWGWHPWGAPVYWGVGAWGWGGPWFGFYGGWWNPYPYYAAPYFWLTDYLISENLQAAYAARAEANADAIAADAQASSYSSGGGSAPAPASNAVVLTPEVKQAIAEEVKAQLEAQQSQAPTGASNAGPAPTSANGQVPPALDPAQRTFVVDTTVTAVGNGQECALTSGDVVTRLTDTPDGDQMVSASVSATKQGDCPSGQTVSVKVDDLQEMYNHFQEQITNGMGELAKKQGTNGMPAAPDTATSPSDVPTPPPDDTAAKALQDQQQQADQTEQQVKQDAASSAQ